MILPRHKYNPPDEVMFRQMRSDRIEYKYSFEDRLTQIIKEETGINPFKGNGCHDAYLVEARQLFAVFMRKYTKHTLSKIGEILNKTHATVISSEKHIADLYLTDSILRGKYDRIEKRVKKLK